MIEIDLSGKTAIVTGGGQGLGAEICHMLDMAGSNVIVNYFMDREGKNQKLAEGVLAELGNKGLTIEADVRDPEQIGSMFNKTISQFGKVDIVVNNAGILRDKTIKKMSAEEWQQVIDTNLTGVFNVCRCAAEQIADNGKIINLSSISGILGFFGQSNYSASKAGVIGLTKALSKEMAKRNITVNAVAPGVILTEMGKSIPQEVRDEMMKNIPLRKFGDPEDIANAVVFLCSELSKYITGQVIHVNGGWI
jgi:3-oxoacyl-[acyl-carrier protein] reductase